MSLIAASLITLNVFFFSCLKISADPSVWLDVPVAGDCRGDTIMTCSYTDLPLATWTWSRKFGGDSWSIFMVNGTITGGIPGSASVREQKFKPSSFSLITEGADHMSRGWYKCGQYESKGRYLDMECTYVVVNTLTR
jgi:hypothetical protein